VSSATFASLVFYTATHSNGFDTHASQLHAHRELLRTVSQSVAKLLDDLREHGLSERVVVLMFSEFGRRVKENAQGGTDHGTAGPVILAGAPIRGGLIGTAPDLASLDNGDLKFVVDFRDIYATLLRRWLNIDPTPVLGRRKEDLAIF
jgi:uncharacterized protein (DUF1501 family)